MGPLALKVGEARVTVFNVGDILLGLDEVYDKSVDLSRYFPEEKIGKKAGFPAQSFLIESGGVKVVVDPSDYSRLVAPGHFTPPAGYAPPPALTAQMESVGVAPTEVTHVVVTHLHFDHFAGATRGAGGNAVPTFPKADCIIPEKDWRMSSIAEAREVRDPDVVDTLVAVQQAGRLSLLDGAKDLGGGVSVEPFPGESPGHQVVAVKSKGMSCYCVGDLIHLEEEVEHPELVASWNEPREMESSRARFYRLASAEDAVVMPGHMRPGKVSVKGGRASWRTLDGTTARI
ncbi:MAG: MBL fold metallo-hydrolase [Nitrososphaerota archaeon]|nr:MBL fold metallo-hydrolase [Nitrososphaerota archaeon]